MSIETLDDIVCELADRLGVYGACGVDGVVPIVCEECTCRAGWEASLKERIRKAIKVEEVLNEVLNNEW